MKSLKMQRGKKFSAAMICGLLIAGLSLFQLGCLDEIELPAPKGSENAFVIQGTIVKGAPSTIRVYITRLFDFTGGSLTPVNVLLAEVIDEDGVKLKLPETGPGVYSAEVPEGSPEFTIDFGRSYQLHIISRDGREYYTNYEPLLEVPKADGTSYDVVTVEVIDDEGNLNEKEKLRLYINTPTDYGQPERARLKWGIERTHKVTDTPISPLDSSKVCYLTDDVIGSNFPIANGNDRTDGYLSDFVLYEGTVTTVYGEGAYFHVFQQGLSEGAYQYWEEVKQLVTRSGNMFEPPAGEVSTNLYNPADDKDKVYGYFYCYAQDTIRQYIEPDSVGSPNAPCPPPGGLLTEDGRCAAPVCCNCLDHPRSTTEKPEYWTE